MKNFSYTILVVLCFLAGCATFPFQYVIVDSPSLSDNINTSKEIAQISDNRQNLRWQINNTSELPGAFRVKYHPAYSTKRCIVVEGSIAGGKKKYPVVLDTGASQGVFVNDIHVLENKLPILRPGSGHVYPAQMTESNSQDYGLGLCYMPELRIGQMALAGFQCWYLQRHLELELLGLPIAKDDSIIVGLTVLREFGCIVFDGINREVEFLRDRAFEPEQETLWSKYPLSIEKDGFGNAFLFVRIPVAGELLKVQLDTGSGNGLAVSEELWEKMRHRVQNKMLKDGSDLYPYIGRLACKKGVIEQLQVGDRLIPNAKISVFPADSPLLRDCDAILGMQFFQDIVIVLDFRNLILWVKGRET
jgi:hypothetical protein